MKTKRLSQWINKTKKREYAGTHLIAEFWHGKVKENVKDIKRILITAAKEANNTPLEVIVHKFSPYGLTGIILLAESHIAIHSWPEFNYLAIDIFSCGKKTNPQRALAYLKKEFCPRKIEVREIKRGKL